MKNLKPFDVMFMGSDRFSVGVLKMLMKSPDTWNTISVIVPAEKKFGKSLSQQYTPELQLFAQQKRLDWHPVPSRGIEAFIPPEQFQAPRPTSLLVTASFGSILPPSLLSIFAPERQLNVHPSLLPKYRGASPIQTALMKNESKTGVTILGMNAKGTDRGDIWAQKEVPIAPDSTYHSLVPLLAEESGVLLVKHLRNMITNSTTSYPQDGLLATTAPKIRHSAARVDFRTQTAAEIERLYRAIGHQHNLTTLLPPHSTRHPEPVPLILYHVTLPPNSYLPLHPPPPGTALFHPRLNAMTVQCKEGMILVEGVQLSGRTRVNATDAWYSWRDQGRVGLMESVQLGWWGEEDEMAARRGGVVIDEEEGENGWK